MSGMRRILVFHQGDWLNDGAGWMEHYLFQVLRRIARHGHYIALASHRHALLPWKDERRPVVECVDGVQIARMGNPLLYRFMAKLLLARLVKTERLARQFDVIIDCIDGKPLPIRRYTDFPMLPLVFDLGRGVRGADMANGPVIVVSPIIADKLERTGLPRANIIMAPPGAGGEPLSFGDKEESNSVKTEIPTLVGVGRCPSVLNKAINTLRHRGHAIECDFFVPGGCEFPPDGRPMRTHTLEYAYRRIDEAFSQCCARAWIGYCEAGQEHYAAVMAGAGIPVLCPDTQFTREHFKDVDLGVLYSRYGEKNLVSSIERLIVDEIALKRMGVNATAWASTHQWDKTASMILAAVENMTA